MSGVVPPFGAVLIVAAVVSWELELVTGKCGLKLTEGRRQKAEGRTQN